MSVLSSACDQQSESRQNEYRKHTLERTARCRAPLGDILVDGSDVTVARVVIAALDKDVIAVRAGSKECALCIPALLGGCLRARAINAAGTELWVWVCGLTLDVRVCAVCAHAIPSTCSLLALLNGEVVAGVIYTACTGVIDGVIYGVKKVADDSSV